MYVYQSVISFKVSVPKKWKCQFVITTVLNRVLNMSLKHLGTGSQQPPKVDGKLRLYSMEYCPYAQRARLVLQAKKLPHDIVNINLKDKPEWYFKVHPEGKVPALDTGSETIVESLVIADTLDEKYPDSPLYPKDPEAKKRDQELIKKIEGVTKLYFQIVFAGVEKTLEEWVQEFTPVLEPFENALAGKTFFGGDKPGMVDYMLWPWSERFKVINLTLGEKLSFKEDQNKNLKKWHKAMLEDPAVKATYNEPEKHWKLAQIAQKKLEANYDEI